MVQLGINSGVCGGFVNAVFCLFLERVQMDFLIDKNGFVLYLVTNFLILILDMVTAI